MVLARIEGKTVQKSAFYMGASLAWQKPYLCAMSTRVKNQAEILSKLGIAQLNPMQVAAQEALASSK